MSWHPSVRSSVLSPVSSFRTSVASARIFSPIRNLFQSGHYPATVVSVFDSIQRCFHVSRKRQVQPVFSLEDHMVPGCCLSARVPVRGLQVPVPPHPPPHPHPNSPTNHRLILSPVCPPGRPRARHQCCELQRCGAAGDRRQRPPGQTVGRHTRFVPHARHPEGS